MMMNLKDWMGRVFGRSGSAAGATGQVVPAGQPEDDEIRPPAAPASLLERLMGSLERTEEIELSCDEVYELIDQFAELTLRGLEAARLLPLVQKHLEMCPDCREEYEALLRVLVIA